MDSTLESIDEVLKEGKDLNNLLWEIIKYVKDILVYKVTKKLDLYSENEIKNIDQIAKKVSKERLINLVYELSEIENNIKWSNQKLIMFQAGIIRLCNKENSESKGLESRVEKIEKYLKSGNVSAVNTQNTSSANSIQNTQVSSNIRVQNAKPEQPKRTQSSGTNARKSFSKNSEEYWPQIMSDLRSNGKIVLYTNLMGTRAKEINDMTVGIEFPNGMTSFGRTVLEKHENVRELSSLVSIACGKEMQIKYIDNSNKHVEISNEENIKNLASELDIPFNIIE